jgi:hypothetical protein
MSEFDETGSPQTSLEFLQSIYRDDLQLGSVRMRAAIAALPFEHPKLQVTMDVSRNFATAMEASAWRSGLHTVIDSDESREDMRAIRDGASPDEVRRERALKRIGRIETDPASDG